jgi:hypothetical protein
MKKKEESRLKGNDKPVKLKGWRYYFQTIRLRYQNMHRSLLQQILMRLHEDNCKYITGTINLNGL